MQLKIRLSVASFLQFLVWGSWLTSLGVYMGANLNFTGREISEIYSTMGIAAILMPALVGIISDRWINAEKVLAFNMTAGSIILFMLSQVQEYYVFWLLMLLYTMLYMPTLGLINTISYNALKNKNRDVVKEFPSIRVWGTIGFIVGMWIIDFFKWTATSSQLIFAAIISLLYGIYAIFLPEYRPLKQNLKKSWLSISGLDAFLLLKEKKMLVFFIFSMLIGAALQITNTFGQPFLSDFATNDLYKDSFITQHPGIFTSLSQISETLFILTIPFFFKRFGIKTVMLMSILGWVCRFFFFGIGNPGDGFAFLVLSMIIYGMAFDFFNISGSLFIEQSTNPAVRARAQGLFVLMTNGIGTIIGTLGSGLVVQYFTGLSGIRNWPSIWFVFTAYAIILAILFLIFFRTKSDDR